MTITELKVKLASLNSADKAAILEVLLKTLTNGSLGIKKTPGVCGGDACVGNTRIQVWVLVGYRRLGCSDAELFKCYPHLTAADLVNAWAYESMLTQKKLNKQLKKMRKPKTWHEFMQTNSIRCQ